MPDTAAEKKLNAELRLERTGIENIPNPFDEYAIEEALKVKEAKGGTVTALCMGPETAKEALRKAIAMGVEKAVLITDPKLTGSDAWATAYTLSLLGGYGPTGWLRPAGWAFESEPWRVFLPSVAGGN